MKPFILLQNDKKTSPIYIQLYRHIKNEILSGNLAVGERLPSLREISKESGVSITTSSKAYDQLLTEGYIISRPQSGYYVAEIPMSPLKIRGGESHHAAAGGAGATGVTGGAGVSGAAEGGAGVPGAAGGSAGAASAAGCAAHGSNGANYYPDFDDYTFTGDGYLHDMSSFDFLKWKKCSARVFTDYAEMLLFESDVQGEAALRFEICKYLYSSRGVTSTPEQVVIGAGTQQLTTHLARILTRMGIDLICTEDPGYAPIQNIFRDRGFGIAKIPVGKDGIEIDMLPSNISTAVYVSPANQFPTGSVMPIGARYRLLEWAEKNKSIILEDDYDSELRYFGKPIPALQGLDENSRTVYLGSFSSTLFPAVKISYMILPDEMVDIFSSIKADYTQTCSKSEQLTLALFMEDGYYYTNIRKLRSLYAQKLQQAIEAFGKWAAGFVSATNTKSGISMTLKVNSSKPSKELCDMGKSLGLHLLPLDLTFPEAYGSRSKNEKYLIFYFNQVPLDEISSSVKALVTAWKKES